MSAKQHYLRVSGRLYPDGRLFLRPAYLTNNPRDSINVEDSPLAIELRDEAKLILRWGLRYSPAAATSHGRLGDEPSFMPVRAKIPYPPETRVIVFRLHDRILHELQVPLKGPKFTEAVHVTKGKAGFRLTWRTDHPASLPIYYHVRISTDQGKTWRRIASRLERPGLSVSDRQVPGSGILEVVAYDGVNTSTFRTTIAGKRRTGWNVAILSPRPNDKLVPPIELHSTGSFRLHDRAKVLNGKLECVWTANGKEVARGPDGVWENAKPGKYEIVLRASLGKEVAQDAVRIRVHKAA